MDSTKPGTLTATALAEAVAAVDATVVFASPAALRNVAATASDLTPELRRRLTSVRTLLSAGAPVPVPLLQQIQALLPQRRAAHPVRDDRGPARHRHHARRRSSGPSPTPDRTRTASASAGRCPACASASTRSTAHRPSRSDSSSTHPCVTGEICLAADHVKDHYDRLWATQQRSATRRPGWHRTGDVGHLDDQGRLWVEGRLVHVISGPAGPVTPVGIEQRVETLPSVSTAALVGVGPAGTQQSVAVVVPAETSDPRTPRRPLTSRATPSGPPRTRVAAVLVTDRLPVDIRHASKIDRHPGGAMGRPGPGRPAARRADRRP